MLRRRKTGVEGWRRGHGQINGADADRSVARALGVVVPRADVRSGGWGWRSGACRRLADVVWGGIGGGG